MHRIDAIQIKRVNGSSKSNSFRPLYFASEIAWLMKYEHARHEIHEEAHREDPDDQLRLQILVIVRIAPVR